MGKKHIHLVTILKQFFRQQNNAQMLKKKKKKPHKQTNKKQAEEQSVKLTVRVRCWCQIWLVHSLAIDFLPRVDFMTHWQRCATLVIMLLI